MDARHIFVPVDFSPARRPRHDRWPHRRTVTEGDAQDPGRRVLIVEDDPGILSSLAEVIRDEGFLAETAANGYQALDQLGARRPSLILLDLMMPWMDGWKFIAELRARFPTYRDVPVVLMSAVPDLAAQADALAVSAFLRKPFHLQAVIDLLHFSAPEST